MSARKHLALFVLISLGACTAREAPDPARAERDRILSLTAMAVVHRDWQEALGGRGHNIGSVLADGDSVPVFWARNTISASGDATQHGEVRAIQGFLDCPTIGRYAEGFTVYTTLESCAMCTGMMALTRVSRVVYVQADPEYGNVRDALAEMDYPVLFEEHSPPELKQKKLLDAGYENFKEKNPKRSIVEYLLSPAAEQIFASAETELHRYQPQYEENTRVLESARAFLKKVPRNGGDDQLAQFCPSNSRARKN